MPNAQELGFASLSACRKGDRAAWLALYADDAEIEDPVGGCRFVDPSGLGFRGREGLERFWDEVVSRNEGFDFQIHQSYLCGNEAANVCTLTLVPFGGQAFSVNLISVYRATPDGKLASLRAYWDTSVFS